MTRNTKNILRSKQHRLASGGAHATTPGRQARNRATSHQRGYTYEWQQARAEYLEANPLCVMCQARGVVTLANVVDHKVPHRGDMVLFWLVDNWQSLCEHCHNAHKQRQERSVSVRSYRKPK